MVQINTEKTYWLHVNTNIVRSVWSPEWSYLFDFWFWKILIKHWMFYLFVIATSRVFPTSRNALPEIQMKVRLEPSVYRMEIIHHKIMVIVNKKNRYLFNFSHGHRSNSRKENTHLNTVQPTFSKFEKWKQKIGRLHICSMLIQNIRRLSFIIYIPCKQ